MSIRTLTVPVVLVVVAISLTYTSEAPALGVLGSFGTSGPGTLQSAAGIAVDPISGDVYVADREANRVVKYDQSGSFILMFGNEVDETTHGDVCPENPGDTCKVGVAGTGPGQLDGPAGVAVDPTSGDVYVNASGNQTPDNRVARFSSSGQYRSQVVGGQNGAPAFGMDPFFNGIAADTEGNLYVVDFAQAVLEFNPAGEYTGQSFVPPATGGPPSGGVWKWEPVNAAVDADGTLYVTQTFGSPIKFSQSGDALAVLPCNQEAAQTLPAVNLFNGDVFVVGSKFAKGQEFVCRYDTSGKPIEEFQGALVEPPNSGIRLVGLAYGASAGTLYELYHHEVVMYGTFPLPTQGAPAVSLEDWSSVSETSITLKARVNPHSLDTTYSFQYGTNPGFTGATSVPASPGDAGASFLPVTESVNLTGLSPSATYYYRLVAHNAFGGGTTVDGPTQTFTTLAPPPSVTTEAANEETYDAAAVNGTVLPGSTGAASETMWCFQYGTTDAPGYDLGYLPGAPAGDAGQGTEGVPVSARLTRLQPETTYRYRLVAVNSLGLRLSSTACGSEGGHETDGAEGTFTTTTSRPSPLTASGSPVAISQTAATLTGTVDPQGTSTVYDFQLGTDTRYGVDLFGPAGAGSELEPVAVVVSSLQPGTTYHYRLVASNRFGTSYGADMSFTTPGVPSSVLSAPPAPPLIATQPVAFPAESKPGTPASRCSRGYSRDKHGRCLKAKPKKKVKRREKGARERRK